MFQNQIQMTFKLEDVLDEVDLMLSIKSLHPPIIMMMTNVVLYHSKNHEKQQQQQQHVIKDFNFEKVRRERQFASGSGDLAICFRIFLSQNLAFVSFQICSFDCFFFHCVSFVFQE